MAPKERSVVDGMLLLWLRCFHFILHVRIKTQTWLEWFIFPITFYLSSLHFPWCCDYYIKFPFKRKWFIDNSGPSLWAFNCKKKPERVYWQVIQFCSASIHFTVKIFLLSTHPGGMRVMLLSIYIVLLDWCLNWFFLKLKIKTKFIVSICKNHSIVWTTQLWYERKKYEVKMCLVRFFSAKMCKAKWWNKQQ